MRIANYQDRAVLLTPDGAVDIETSSRGQFGPTMRDLYDHWDSFHVASSALTLAPAFEVDEALLENPSPEPRQVFAIGLNYRSHANEMGFTVPSVPATFTKFPSCLAGPYSTVTLSGDTVDWEVELVVIVGRQADHVAVEEAWSHVAGFRVGQDISDRTIQKAAGQQFSLGKSFRGFGPIGPCLVTLDEFSNPSNLVLDCKVNGIEVQRDTTASMIFGVPELISELSNVLTLYPGDVIFTGTPSGAGVARTPPQFLKSGDILESSIEGIGTIRQLVA